jgi:protein-disulfide isomerase
MTPDLAAPVDADDHRRGVTGSKQLVVYGDFECPYTAAAMRDIERLLEGGPSFEVVYRHYPLRAIHPHAQAAAEAAEAAARQDRFWEMHDLLFRNQLRLQPADLRRYAERLDLDLERFESDISDAAIKARVEREWKVAMKAASTARRASSSTGSAIGDPGMRTTWATHFAMDSQ